MQRKQRPEPNEEPAVTFELEEAPQQERRSLLGAAGTAAATGAGLIAGGAAPASPDSLDVFDEIGESDQPENLGGDIPTTSFSEIANTVEAPEFPAIDFDTPEPPGGDQEVDEALHGATGSVGGGFRLDDPSGQEALAAPDMEFEPVSETLVGYQTADDDESMDDADPDDIDLN